MNKSEYQQRLNHSDKIDELLSDQLHSFRNKPFKIGNVSIEPKSEFKLLGQWYDDKWSFITHINKKVNNTNMVRIKAMKLKCSNNNNLNLGVIKSYIDSSALSLLNYAGCIMYTMPKSNLLNPIRTVYNQFIQTMNRFCYTVSLPEKSNFNGFNTFEGHKKNVVSKQFSRFLRNNKQNALERYKEFKINEIANWMDQKYLKYGDYDQFNPFQTTGGTKIRPITY